MNTIKKPKNYCDISNLLDKATGITGCYDKVTFYFDNKEKGEREGFSIVVGKDVAESFLCYDWDNEKKRYTGYACLSDIYLNNKRGLKQFKNKLGDLLEKKYYVRNPLQFEMWRQKCTQ